jgi:glycosyltransferase involved in cell wall biosynthesis
MAGRSANGGIKVAHIITRLIVGGAQENTLFTVEYLRDNPVYEATLITGPALGPEGSLIQRARDAGVKMIILRYMRRAVNPVFDLITYLGLYSLIRRAKYDIVHTHSSKAGILGRMAAKAAGVPIIVHTIHGLPFHRYQNRVVNRIYVALERYAAKFTDKIVTVADAMVDAAVEAKIAPREKFITIYSGIEIGRFKQADAVRDDVRKELNIPGTCPVIGKIARLFHLKGHEYVLDAAVPVVMEFPEVRFLFVGDGILRHSIEHRIRLLGMQKNFIFTGLVSPDKIPQLVTAMDILVHASLREGLPRAVVQAMICRKPVVAFDVDGAREVVIDGETGYLIPPKDSKKLGQALLQLLHNRERAREMGEEGYRLVESRFDVTKMVDDISELYEKLTKMKSVGQKQAVYLR